MEKSSLYLRVLLNNTGGILYTNGHKREARDMYKTALELATQRLERMAGARTEGLNQELRPEEIATHLRGEKLLHDYRNTLQLHIRRSERAKQSSSSLYYNHDYYSEPIKLPLKLFRGSLLTTSQIMIEALVLSTFIFNVAMQYQDKLVRNPDDINHLSEASNLYHEVYVLAQNITSTSQCSSTSQQSCRILALAHFLKLAALNNLSSLSSCVPEHTIFLYDSSDLLLQHVASKHFRSLKWAKFPSIQQETTNFVLRAILSRSKRAMAKKWVEQNAANNSHDGEGLRELGLSCCPATSSRYNW
jgi:hypothetical protein